MLAIIDGRSPKEAIKELSKYVDDIFCFGSEGITYNSISGHPDIFIYQDTENLVVAPNAPAKLFEFLEQKRVEYHIGETYIDDTLKGSTAYNCISSNKFLFHKSLVCNI